MILLRHLGAFGLPIGDSYVRDIDVKAFQNGVELTIIVYTGQKTEDAVQCDTAVPTGTTAKVVWLYEKQDDSTVSVEFSDGQKHEFEIVAE